MGRIRQGNIKTIAHEVVKKYRAELSEDFAKNRKFLNTVLKSDSKFLKNKIAGYVTHILKHGRASAAVQAQTQA